MTRQRSSKQRYDVFVEDYKHRRLDEKTDAKDRLRSGTLAPGSGGEGDAASARADKAQPEAARGPLANLLRGSRRDYLREYVRWLRPHRYQVATVFAFAVVAAGLQMVEPLFMKFIIDDVL